MKVSVGIDVSKATLDVCYKGESTSKIQHQRFDNTPSGHRQLLTWLKRLNGTLDNLSVILEATGFII